MLAACGYDRTRGALWDFESTLPQTVFQPVGIGVGGVFVEVVASSPS